MLTQSVKIHSVENYHNCISSHLCIRSLARALHLPNFKDNDFDKNILI